MPLLSYAYLAAVILSGIYLFLWLIPSMIDKVIVAIKSDSPALWNSTKNLIVITIVLIIVWTINAVTLKTVIIP